MPRPISVASAICGPPIGTSDNVVEVTLGEGGGGGDTTLKGYSENYHSPYRFPDGRPEHTPKLIDEQRDARAVAFEPHALARFRERMPGYLGMLLEQRGVVLPLARPTAAPVGSASGSLGQDRPPIFGLPMGVVDEAGAPPPRRCSTMFPRRYVLRPRFRPASGRHPWVSHMGADRHRLAAMLKKRIPTRRPFG